ncbi:MAG: DNA replication/repair protein RecF [Myxococcota bacterium]
MRLRRLVVDRFRNLDPADIALDAPFVVLHGANAQGKTNTLEAVHVVATLKPLRGRRLTETIGWGEPEAHLAGWVEHDGQERHHRVDLDRRRKSREVRLDGKKVQALEDYFATIRAIAFTPRDGRIVSGDPAFRRNWIDRAAFTASPSHLERVRAYRQCLSQKSSLLRSEAPDRQLLRVIDEQLATLGADLAERRARMVDELTPYITSLHETIAMGHGKVAIEYRTRAAGDDLAARREALRERIAEVSPRELERGTTLAGPQLDDVKVSLDGKSVRDYASRGQIRSLVLSLKLAEMVAARQRDQVPLFLIDDASTELDRDRTSRLMGLLQDLGAQVIATTTDPAPLTSSLPSGEVLEITVDAGKLSGSQSLDPPPPDRLEEQE